MPAAMQGDEATADANAADDLCRDERALRFRRSTSRNASLADLYCAFAMMVLWRCYHQILGPRRHLAKFANRLCRHSGVWVRFDPHLAWQPAKSDVEGGDTFWLISHEGFSNCPVGPPRTAHKRNASMQQQGFLNMALPRGPPDHRYYKTLQCQTPLSAATGVKEKFRRRKTGWTSPAPRGLDNPLQLPPFGPSGPLIRFLAPSPPSKTHVPCSVPSSAFALFPYLSTCFHHRESPSGS
jgi:hypothetical protein